MHAGGVRIPLQELLQQPNKELQFPLYDRSKQAAGNIQVDPFLWFASSSSISLGHLFPCTRHLAFSA